MKPRHFDDDHVDAMDGAHRYIGIERMTKADFRALMLMQFVLLAAFVIDAYLNWRAGQ